MLLRLTDLPPPSSFLHLGRSGQEKESGLLFSEIRLCSETDEAVVKGGEVSGGLGDHATSFVIWHLS